MNYLMSKAFILMALLALATHVYADSSFCLIDQQCNNKIFDRYCCGIACCNWFQYITRDE